MIVLAAKGKFSKQKFSLEMAYLSAVSYQPVRVKAHVASFQQFRLFNVTGSASK